MSSSDDRPSELRIWEVQHTVEDRLRTMTKAELNGAMDVLSVFHSYLYRTHFTEQKDIPMKALVKTVEELWEIGGEILHHTVDAKTTIPSS